MRILHLIPNLDKGGAERICLDICEELQNKGHIVKIFMFEDINRYKKVYPNIDIEFIPITYKLSLIRSNNIDIHLLTKKVNEFNPEAIHSHLFYANIIGLELKPKNHIIHIHSNTTSLRKIAFFEILINPKKLGIYYEQRRVFSSIKHSNVTFLTIAKESFNYITKNIGYLKPNIVFIHNAINLQRFKTKERKKNNKKFHITSIARLVKYKGHDLTIEIADVLREMNFHFFITIYGKGPEHNNLQNLINKKELNSFVKLAGITDYPEKALADSDLYFHSTKNEPFGLVLIEAMASGIPVITTDGKGNRDLIQDRVNGLFFYKRDPKAIAKAIIEIKSDHILRNILVKNGSKYAESFGINSYCKKLERLYIT